MYYKHKHIWNQQDCSFNNQPISSNASLSYSTKHETNNENHDVQITLGKREVIFLYCIFNF